jgi:rhamnulokinase
MTPTSFIAVDLGGQSGRVLVGTFSDDGFDLIEAHRFANVPIMIDGLLCWDVTTLFEQTLTGISAAVTYIVDTGSTVGGIAVDSWGVDYGLIGADGSLIAPVRHYRANTQESVDLANQRVPAAEAYGRTGIVELSINTVYQLVRDASLGLLGGAATMLLTPDLWTYRLTGQVAAESTIASTTGLVDARTGTWAFDLVDRWGLPGDLLPNVGETGSLAGWTTREVSARIGAPEPIRVFRAPAHDTASAFAAVVSPGDSSGVISCGTWALVGCSATAPVLTEDARSAGFTNERGAEGSTLLIRNLSGTWLLDECLREWTSADSAADPTLLRAELLAAAAREPASEVTIDPGAAELIVSSGMVDALAGLHARKGGRARLSRAQTVRLVVDSLAASFADSVHEAGRLTGVTPERIHMIGGGSQIELLVQLTQAASGLPVVVGHPEATSVGNICVQAVAAGLFANLVDARAAASRPSATSLITEGDSHDES